MTTRKILILIPLIAIAGYPVHTWFNILFGIYVATWMHYVGLLFFLPLIFLFFRNLDWATIGTGIFLLLGLINTLAITSDISTVSFGIGPIFTPPMQPIFIALFALYIILNFKVLMNLYLDHEEAKWLKQKNKNST